MKNLLVSKILSILMLFVNGESQVTLTTATVCDSNCLKPTSLYRRIHVDRNVVEDKRSTPLIFFRGRNDKMNS